MTSKPESIEKTENRAPNIIWADVCRARERAEYEINRTGTRDGGDASRCVCV